MSKAPAVDYALKIIEYLANENEDLGIADISNGLGINKNAVSRVLESLTENGWIYCKDNLRKKYALTLKPFSVISKSMRKNILISIAEPYVKEINQITGYSTYLGVRKEGSVIYLLHCDSSKEVRINGCVGGEYPLHCAAPGKVLLAWDDTNHVSEYFKSLTYQGTSNAITEFSRFITEAENIKKNGYAVDNEEFGKGIICLAVPILDDLGNVVASIGISSLTIYDDMKSLISDKGNLIVSTAKKISESLGYEKHRKHDTNM